MDNTIFYVDLPSDSSMERYPANHGGEYTVDLPISLQLSSHQWEAGLVEAIFNQEWSPVVIKDLWVQICIDKGNSIFAACGAAYVKETKVPETNMEDFADVWTKLLEPMFKRAMKKASLWVEGTDTKNKVFNMSFDKASKRFTLTITPNEAKRKTALRLEMSTSLLNILGFTRFQLSRAPKGSVLPTKHKLLNKQESRYFFSNSEGKIVTPPSHFTPSISRGITSLWIYTDLVKPHITGHTFSPLLRVIAVDHSMDGGSARVVRFNQVHYYPLTSGNISSIHIKITNQGGLEPVNFAVPVTMKLHFRKRDYAVAGSL